MSALTVIGLGPMGQAMTHALLKNGHAVTVWNRTPARAAEVVAAGAKLAPTARDAIVASNLVVLSLTDYQAMYDVVPEDAIAGRTIVNLSSDTPARTREASIWAGSHGAAFLTGGVMVPAPAVGTAASFVYYSGPEEVLRTHEPVLRVIGTPRWTGEDPGLAQLYYQAQLDVFLTTLSGVLHAVALVGSAGASAAQFLPEAVLTLQLAQALVGEPQTAQRIDRGEHPGDLSTITMMGATADHIVGASEEAGIDLELPRAVQSHYARAIAAGYGRNNWTGLLEILRG